MHNREVFAKFGWFYASGVHEVILLALGVLLALGKAAGVVVCTLADRTYIFNENTGPQLVGNRGYSRVPVTREL